MFFCWQNLCSIHLSTWILTTADFPPWPNSLSQTKLLLSHSTASLDSFSSCTKGETLWNRHRSLQGAYTKTGQRAQTLFTCALSPETPLKLLTSQGVLLLGPSGSRPQNRPFVHLPQMGDSHFPQRAADLVACNGGFSRTPAFSSGKISFRAVFWPMGCRRSEQSLTLPGNTFSHKGDSPSLAHSFSPGTAQMNESGFSHP